MGNVIVFRHGEYDFREDLTSDSKRLIAKKTSELLESKKLTSKKVVLLVSTAKRAINSAKIIEEVLKDNNIETETEIKWVLLSRNWGDTNFNNKVGVKRAIESFDSDIILVTHYEWSCLLRNKDFPLSKGCYEVLDKKVVVENLSS